MEGVFTCYEIKVSFAGAGLWRRGCEQNVNGEKSLCFGAVLTPRFERFRLFWHYAFLTSKLYLTYVKLSIERQWVV